MKKKVLPIIAGAMVAISLVSSLAAQTFAESVENSASDVSVLAASNNSVHYSLEKSISQQTQEENLYIAGDEITITGRMSDLVKADDVPSNYGLSAYWAPLKWDPNVFDIVSVEAGADIDPDKNSVFSNTFISRPEQVRQSGEMMVQWQTKFDAANMDNVLWLFDGAEMFTVVLKVKDDAPLGATEVRFFTESSYSVSASVGLANSPTDWTVDDVSLTIVDELSVVHNYVDENGNDIQPADVVSMAPGSSYTTAVPEFAGYTFKQATLDGQPITVDANGEVTINSVVTRHVLVFEYQTVQVRTDYNIVSEYVDVEGNTIRASKTETVRANGNYIIDPPVIEDYVLSNVYIDGVVSELTELTSIDSDHTIRYEYLKAPVDPISSGDPSSAGSTPILSTSSDQSNNSSNLKSSSSNGNNPKTGDVFSATALMILLAGTIVSVTALKKRTK